MKTFFIIIVFLLMSLAALNLMFGSRMPWYAWIDANIPVWAAVINIICFSIISIIFITDLKHKFTKKQSKVLLVIGLISFFLLNVSLEKAPILVAIAIAILLLLRLKLAFWDKTKKKRNESIRK